MTPSSRIVAVDQPHRREFLRASALGTVGAALGIDGASARSTASSDLKCIVLFLTGGPSHLETWDPKPDAPSNVRGPFQATRTTVPGVVISERLPRMAALAQDYAIVRTVHHGAPAIHETGQQLLQTGCLSKPDEEQPTLASRRLAARRAAGLRTPQPVLLPFHVTNTGVCVSHGQGAGHLGSEFEAALPWANGADPWTMVNARLQSTPNRQRERYGWTTFGQSCLLAKQLLEKGSDFVTVNMFDTVYDQVTWDCHADGGSLASTLDDYKDWLCPAFDWAYSALLLDLRDSGMLANTLVVAMGEMGRTPHLNYRGGRDHWTHCWSVLLAGGPIRGGQVIGTSDELGGEPKDRPVRAAEIAATILHALGIQEALPAEPVHELFT